MKKHYTEAMIKAIYAPIRDAIVCETACGVDCINNSVKAALYEAADNPRDVYVYTKEIYRSIYEDAQKRRSWLRCKYIW